ncbi:hypothetical protein A3L12_07060 [Thermococcus sp. P6]|uniref:helix-turn-helix transcriptional regulator n=1 Tax=Thermococcus sp. P6 TaxID=122420 RepID=UPI000B59E477|nr:MarR family transcriptional regulator [Thermococcus sp. P6]ASJ11074.1 hypothetical protein A3L12_07060 [Thermococcus sp. P6]
MPSPQDQKPRGRESALIGLALIFSLALSFLFLPQAGAQEDYGINAYAVYFEVLDGDNIRETIEIDLTPYTNLTRYVIYTDYPVENASAVLELGTAVEGINVTVRKVLGDTSAIYLTFPALKPDQNARIRLSFTTMGMLTREGEKSQFTYYIKFSQPIGVFHMQLIVPEGYAVLSPIIPSPDRVESSANRLLLEWKRNNLDPGDELYFVVGFSGKITVPEPPSPWLYAVFFLSGLLIGAGGFYAYTLYASRKREDELEHLRSDEERILAILREGPVLQSELAQKLGVSKAKVSITLREMEKKGLIDRVKEGRTYRVFLRE